MSPNIAQTVTRGILTVAIVTGVAIHTCGCKASGHIDFEIDLPAVELERIRPARSPEP